MQNYEIVFMVHPDQSAQVPAMIERYHTMIETGGGNVHRLEDWGRRVLAYPINKLHKAHYVLMNIECDIETMDKLAHAFKFNDTVIRNLVIKRDTAETEMSPIAKLKQEEEERAQAAAAKAALQQNEAAAAPDDQGDAQEVLDDATESQKPEEAQEALNDATESQQPDGAQEVPDDATESQQPDDTREVLDNTTESQKPEE